MTNTTHNSLARTVYAEEFGTLVLLLAFLVRDVERQRRRRG